MISKNLLLHSKFNSQKVFYIYLRGNFVQALQMKKTSKLSYYQFFRKALNDNQESILSGTNSEYDQKVYYPISEINNFVNLIKLSTNRTDGNRTQGMNQINFQKNNAVQKMIMIRKSAFDPFNRESQEQQNNQTSPLHRSKKISNDQKKNEKKSLFKESPNIQKKTIFQINDLALANTSQLTNWPCKIKKVQLKSKEISYKIRLFELNQDLVVQRQHLTELTFQGLKQLIRTTKQQKLLYALKKARRVFYIIKWKSKKQRQQNRLQTKDHPQNSDASLCSTFEFSKNISLLHVQNGFLSLKQKNLCYRQQDQTITKVQKLIFAEDLQSLSRKYYFEPIIIKKSNITEEQLQKNSNNTKLKNNGSQKDEQKRIQTNNEQIQIEKKDRFILLYDEEVSSEEKPNSEKYLIIQKGTQENQQNFLVQPNKGNDFNASEQKPQQNTQFFHQQQSCQKNLYQDQIQQTQITIIPQTKYKSSNQFLSSKNNLSKRQSSFKRRNRKFSMTLIERFLTEILAQLCEKKKITKKENKKRQVLNFLQLNIEQNINKFNYTIYQRIILASIEICLTIRKIQFDIAEISQKDFIVEYAQFGQKLYDRLHQIYDIFANDHGSNYILTAVGNLTLNKLQKLFEYNSVTSMDKKNQRMNSVQIAYPILKQQERQILMIKKRKPMGLKLSESSDDEDQQDQSFYF